MDEDYRVHDEIDFSAKRERFIVSDLGKGSAASNSIHSCSRSVLILRSDVLPDQLQLV